MKIPSEKLGEIEIDESSIINFVSPIIGFEQIKQYVIIVHLILTCKKSKHLVLV